jgi:FtsP/CotA-like multicopper oxidase with cupredoxin domain
VLRVREGDRVVVTFVSTVPAFDHTIHWHGVHVPWRQDGVPYVTQDPIPAGQEGGYEFIAEPAGTMWYHCHVDTQHHLDMGMYGALIIEPRDPASEPAYDKEAILMLDEMDRYHLESGTPVVGNQPQSGDAFDLLQYGERTAQDVVGRNQVVQQPITGTPLRPARDWYPVTYLPYHADLNTFVINGHAFPHTEPIFLGEGETLRLRLINAGDQLHAMHLHGHHMLVTHKDGVLLASPYWADTIAIAPGERYDAYVRGTNPGIWDFHDHVNSNLQNDHIHPGGMMTLLVYEQYRDEVGHGHAGHGRYAGDYVGLRR